MTKKAAGETRIAPYDTGITNYRKKNEKNGLAKQTSSYYPRYYQKIKSQTCMHDLRITSCDVRKDILLMCGAGRFLMSIISHTTKNGYPAS